MRFLRASLLSICVALSVGFALLAQAPDPATPAASKGKGKGKAADVADPGAANAKGKGRGGATAEKAPAPPPIPQVLRLVRPNLYMVTGHGANVLFHPTPAGVIVVDTKLPGDDNFERLVEYIHGITDQPVKVVYNTHHHQDHTGNNAKFLAAGAQVIGSEALKTALATYVRNPQPAPPSVTFATTHVTKLGGVEVRAYHFGAGHTAGDSVILFPAERLLAISDLVTVGNGPMLDYPGGGSLLGWLKSLDESLKLDWTTAVPGNGDPVDRAYVEKYRQNLQVLLDRVRQLMTRGIAPENALSQIQTADLGWRINWDAATFTQLYAEIRGN